MDSLTLKDISLKDIILTMTGQKPSPTKLSNQTHLSLSTLNDALKRPIEHTSFGVVTKILKAQNIQMDQVVDQIVESTSPEIEEKEFVQSTNEDQLTIMGIQFTNKDNFWKTRESIISSIYEGFHPTKQNVIDSYQLLEKHVPLEKMVNEVLEEYREN